MSRQRLEEAHGAAAPRPRLRLVRRRSRALVQRSPGTRLAPVALLVAICTAALVVAVLLEQVILAQSAFKLARIRRQTAAAEARNQELLLRTTKLQSPRRLERYARTRLGMVAPGSVEYIVADVGTARAGLALARPSTGLPGAARAFGASRPEGAP
jgi:cell division protein FtsB